MKFIRIKNYVEHGFEIFPSYILVMEVDGEYIDYISNGCLFMKNTEINREILIERYKCEKELEELLLANPISNNDIVDARYMFCGCEELTEFKVEMPRLKKSRSMFKGCKNLVTFESDMEQIKRTTDMFKDCNHIPNFKCNKPHLNPPL